MYTFTVYGQSYNVSGSYAFVKYEVALMTSKYGTDLDVRTPRAIRYRANLFGSRYGV